METFMVGGIEKEPLCFKLILLKGVWFCFISGYKYGRVYVHQTLYSTCIFKCRLFVATRNTFLSGESRVSIFLMHLILCYGIFYKIMLIHCIVELLYAIFAKLAVIHKFRLFL